MTEMQNSNKSVVPLLYNMYCVCIPSYLFHSYPFFANRIHPTEIKYTTDTSASFLNLHLEIKVRGGERYFTIKEIPELVVPIRISLIEGCCQQGGD
jgi:hypothetical protein